MINKARIESAETGYIIWLVAKTSSANENATRYVFATLTEATSAIHSFMQGYETDV